VNIGSRDNFDWMSLNYLKETLDLGRDVFSRRKRRFSFFNTDPEHTDKVMEVNNVQLEGRRINVEISKMMVAEDVITTEEVLVVVVLVWKKFCSKKRRQFCTKREGSGGGRSDRNSGPREGGFVEEALLQEKVLAEEVQLRGEGSSDRAQDVLKVLVTHLDQEDQEETNLLLIFL
jgi:ATP-dependent RNA helicase DeaD